MVLISLCLMIAPVFADCTAIDRVTVEEKIIALTLDNVEDAAELEKVLALCKKENIRVSFFSPSYFVDSQQTIVKKAVSEGHEFGNCGVKQANWEELREEDITKEYRAADAVLHKVVRVKKYIVKPADGQYEDKFLSAITAFHSASIAIRGMTIDGKMIEEENPCFIQNGNILAVSMKEKEAVASLPKMFRILKDKGYQIVTVSELLHKGSEYCK